MAGVRCNCVRHATLSAPDTFAYAIVSGAMQKPSGGHVHVCARVLSEHACTEVTTYIMQHEYSRILWLQRIPKRPNISHVIYDMHLAGKKKWWTFSDDQGGFTARTVLHGGGHNCMCQWHNCMRHRQCWCTEKEFAPALEVKLIH